MFTSQIQTEQAPLETDITYITGTSDLTFQGHDDSRCTSTPRYASQNKREQSFPLTKLPSELRHEIYAYYFSSVLPQAITCTSISSHRSSLPSTSATPKNTLPPYHHINPLSLSTPFFIHDIPLHVYYQNTVFEFSCPSALKTFSSSSHAIIKTHVRKLRILYGNIGEKGPDWVFLILNGFEDLREISWVAEEGCKCRGVGSEKLEGWWRCVSDAVREGTESKRCGRKNDDKRRGKRLNMRLEVKRGDEIIIVKEC